MNKVEKKAREILDTKKKLSEKYVELDDLIEEKLETTVESDTSIYIDSYDKLELYIYSKRYNIIMTSKVVDVKMRACPNNIPTNEEIEEMRKEHDKLINNIVKLHKEIYDDGTYDYSVLIDGNIYN